MMNYATIDTPTGTIVRPVGWGYGVPLWCSDSRAIVVGRGRNRLRIQFSCEEYGETYPFRTVVPSMLAIVPEVKS